MNTQNTQIIPLSRVRWSVQICAWLLSRGHCVSHCPEAAAYPIGR